MFKIHNVFNKHSVNLIDNFKFWQILKLLRPHQYYKNLLIYVGLIFGGQFTDINKLVICTFGFIVLCMISSAGYVYNDIVDKEIDKYNSEKALRPITLGIISTNFAKILILVCCAIGTIIWMTIYNWIFLLLTYMILINTIIYTNIGKKLPFVEILQISINYIMRIYSGCVITNIDPSLWLIVIGFIFAIFLIIAKRYNELIFLGENAIKSRNVYSFYTEKILNRILVISGVVLIVIFTIYVFNHESLIMILNLPVLFLVIFRLYFLTTYTEKGRNFHLMLIDKYIFSLSIMFFIIVYYSIYL